MSNRTKILLATCSLALSAVALAKVEASAKAGYPIPELGHCRDTKECRLYCEIPANKASCWSYEKYVLHGQASPAVASGEGRVRASQSDQEIAQAHGITFPISELGNCGSIDECRAYCDNPANQTACLAFAQRHGIGESGEQQTMLEAAKTELGCNSIEACQAFCENPANQPRCMEFAEKYAPEEYHQRKNEMVSRARDTLGCDSFESCQNFCKNPENIDRCMEFAEKYAPAGLQKRRQEFVENVGKNLPCNSFATCRAYCEANPATCQQSISDTGTYHIEIHKEEGFTCNTPEQCQAYCEQNPDKCPGYQQPNQYQSPLPPGNYPSYEGTSPPPDYANYPQSSPSDYQNYPAYDQNYQYQPYQPEPHPQ